MKKQISRCLEIEHYKPKNSYSSHRIIDSFYKTKTSFVRPEGPNVMANKTGIKFMIFILKFVENCL